MANQVCISIGIDRYQFLPPLGYAIADAVAMDRFFIESAGWDVDRCLLLTDTSPQCDRKSTYPDRENINRWLKQWSWEKLRPGDLVWFFFSGCGVSYGDDDYLVPIDGDPDRLANTCISIRQLYGMFRDIGVNALVFLDANRAQHLSIGSGIGNVTAKLAQDYQIPTFLSCQYKEFSSEDASLKHGLFTTALLETLNYHPDLNLETIDSYLSTRMVELCEHHWKPLQTPLSILPDGISPYRPVFSATTQAAISTPSTPEVIYTPPQPERSTPANYASTNERPNFAPYSIPQLDLSLPERPTNAGKMVVWQDRQPKRREVPRWQTIGAILTALILAGGSIYLLKGSSENKEPAVSQPASYNSIDNPQIEVPVVAAVSNEDATAALERARAYVKPSDATSRYQAILIAQKISPNTPEIQQQVRESIATWSDEIYQIAQGYADKQMWKIAIGTAQMIPKDASIYPKAQAAMAEWSGKQ